MIWFNLACSLQDGGDDILGLQVLTRVGCSTGCLKSWFGKWSCSLHEPSSIVWYCYQLFGIAISHVLSDDQMTSLSTNLNFVFML